MTDAWSTACPDWEDRILNRRSLIPDLPLYEGEAEKALRIFKRLRCPDIEGFPTYGEICDDWVFDLVRAVFGSYDAALKRRMIREFFLLIPKKNGKSSIAAAIMVTAIIMNRRPEAELLLVAPTKKIADIAFKQANGIIRLDPALTKLFHPQAHQRTITHRITLAAIIIKAADTDVITGSKATFILVDETHVFAKMARAADVFVEIRGSLASRPDGFLIQITTQSKEPPSGVFKAELDTARDVRDGKIKLPLLAILYELPLRIVKDGGWKDPKTWPLVNPNLNRSVDPAFLADEILKAEREGDAKLALLASQHFNVEIGLGLRNDAWPGATHWLDAVEEGLSLDGILERCDVVVVGVDGGGLDDLLGLSVLGREKVTRRWLLWTKAWVHRGVLKLRRSEEPKLTDLANTGDLVIVDSLDLAFQELADIVECVHQKGLLAKVGLDPVGVALIVDALAERKIGGEHDLTADRVVGVSQGYKLSGTIKTAEVQLSEKRLVHSGQALMSWCVGNAKVEPRGNATVITKQASGTAKIDPLMATFNAVALMAQNPEPPRKTSVYEALARARAAENRANAA